ncbi:hypothetical protein [Haliscomenobacter hydrossis]|uniref:Uncharacterized protein n=1 Tax=Haliscomenobacter hydrossis (strain ATCC 27775 / DSM 1100 / LMG 10767 / O) TaxID=760192 RepID=F4L0X0_HALH1|nr:hypothetical protein [Haliscomenobacter hydrossis]AEE50574.1 hypothetical protein Halhy_2706 [Haliscomenobacter hydrossis DSM 1100]
MNPTKSFIRFTAICGLLSVITTLGIHLFFPEFSPNFNERLLLYKNSIYLLNRWWVIVHCLLVLFSMWGFYLIQRYKSPGFTGLGLMFFAVFSFTEIARQLLVLFYVNGLRVKYLSTEDPILHTILKTDIENFNLISNSLFGLFILATALGNLFYSLSLWKETGFGKVLSWLLVVWSLGNFTALTIEFYPSNTLEKMLAVYSYTYQPLMRLLISRWLWRKSNE